jgi:hypothetical protein
MPEHPPTIWQSIVQGGVLMGPFLILTLVWIGLSLRYACGGCKRRSASPLLGFPVAFGLLAIANITLNLKRVYVEVWNTGETESMQYALAGVICVRATLAVLTVAGASLLSYWIFACIASTRKDADSPCP